MSWDQLAAIYREQREEEQRETRKPPVACPKDGIPLETGPRGELHCRFCGWTSTTGQPAT